MKVHCEVEAFEVNSKEVPTVTNGKKPCIDVDNVPTDIAKVKLTVGGQTMTVNATELANAIKYAGWVRADRLP